MVISLIQEPF